MEWCSPVFKFWPSSLAEHKAVPVCHCTSLKHHLVMPEESYCMCEQCMSQRHLLFSKRAGKKQRENLIFNVNAQHQSVFLSLYLLIFLPVYLPHFPITFLLQFCPFYPHIFFLLFLLCTFRIKNQIPF